MSYPQQNPPPYAQSPMPSPVQPGPPGAPPGKPSKARWLLLLLLIPVAACVGGIAFVYSSMADAQADSVVVTLCREGEGHGASRAPTMESRGHGDGFQTRVFASHNLNGGWLENIINNDSMRQAVEAAGFEPPMAQRYAQVAACFEHSDAPGEATCRGGNRVRRTSLTVRAYSTNSGRALIAPFQLELTDEDHCTGAVSAYREGLRRLAQALTSAAPAR